MIEGQHGMFIQMHVVPAIDEYKISIELGGLYEFVTKKQARELGEWLIKQGQEKEEQVQ